MDISRTEALTFGISGARLVWLNVSPPLQPAANDAEAAPGFGPVDVFAFVAADRYRHHVSRRPDTQASRCSMQSSTLELVDPGCCREWREMMSAIASLGVGEYPSWLIVAIEREPTGPALESRRL